MSGGGIVLFILLGLYVVYEGVKAVMGEVLDYRWRRSLTVAERYHECRGCGRTYDATFLGSSSEHWRCGEYTFRSRS